MQKVSVYESLLTNIEDQHRLHRLPPVFRDVENTHLVFLAIVNKGMTLPGQQFPLDSDRGGERAKLKPSALRKYETFVWQSYGKVKIVQTNILIKSTIPSTLSGKKIMVLHIIYMFKNLHRREGARSFPHRSLPR